MCYLLGRGTVDEIDNEKNIIVLKNQCQLFSGCKPYYQKLLVPKDILNGIKIGDKISFTGQFAKDGLIKAIEIKEY